MANARTTAKNSNWLAGALTLTEQSDGSSISTGEMGFVRVGDVVYLKNSAGTLVAIANAAGAIPVANAATTAGLAANTYANGTAGVGATITADANGALGAIDGVTLTAGQSLLVKNESGGDAPNNGLYVVTQVGTAGTPFILTRDERFDQAAEMQDGWAVIVAAGTLNADTLWLLTGTVATVGTTDVTFSRESGVMLLASAQTVTGAKDFAAGTLKVDNNSTTNAHTMVSAATAARTATFPDASFTIPQDSLVVHLAGAEVITGAKTFADGTLKLRNAGDTFSTTLSTGATAARAVAFPDAAGTVAVSATTPATLSAAGDVGLVASFIGAAQSLSGPGAIDVVTRTTKFTSTGAGDALTLANGTYTGQRKNVVHTVDGGSGVITPNAAGNFATVTLTNRWESVEFEWNGAAWDVVAASPVAIVA